MQYKKTDDPVEELVVKNREAFKALLGHATITEATIPIATMQQAGTRRTQKEVRTFLNKELGDCTDIIIDINSMPKSVAMTAVAVALKFCDLPANRHRINLLVVVNHDPELDRRIKQTDAFFDPFIHAEFLSGFEVDATETTHAIWMPILGPGRVAQVKKIAQAKWAPKDFCPVVPSPSRDPKAADSLIVEYGDTLVNEDGSPALNTVLRVSEENPIEAYEGFLSTIRDFVRVYQILGGCRVLVSSHSTKLLSLAGLLAIYEARQGPCPGASYAFVEGGGHRLEAPTGHTSKPFVLWLTGEPYA